VLRPAGPPTFGSADDETGGCRAAPRGPPGQTSSANASQDGSAGRGCSGLGSDPVPPRGGAGAWAQGSSLSGCGAGSHGGRPDTWAFRAGAGRCTAVGGRRTPTRPAPPGAAAAPVPAAPAAGGNALPGMAAPAASLARLRGSDGIRAHGGSFALVVAVESWLAGEAGSTGATSSAGGDASVGGTPGEPGSAGEPESADAPAAAGGAGADANPDDADPVKPEDADPANPDIADPVKPEDGPEDPDIADPVKPDDPVKPGEDDPPKPEDPVKPGEADPPKPGEADPPKVGEADPGMAGLSGAGINPAGWNSGAASASGAGPPTTAGARGAVGAPFFTVPFLAGPFLDLPFLTGPFLALPFLTVPGLRTGTWVAARTSASRADRACCRRHARTAKINPSRSRKTTPAMAASMTSLLLMLRWIGLLCVAGGVGGD
jgi:hypothetical protein